MGGNVRQHLPFGRLFAHEYDEAGVRDYFNL